jgi:mRNA-degrading endonuclease RelE of RelBE toxin-antitoxin system
VSYKVEITPTFSKEFKPLAKKYRSLQSELTALIDTLKENPEMGTPLGQNCYKIRLGIKSKGRGKSSGGRIITQVFVLDRTVYLLSIYDKSKRSTITDADLVKLIGARQKMPE